MGKFKQIGRLAITRWFALITLAAVVSVQTSAYGAGGNPSSASQASTSAQYATPLVTNPNYRAPDRQKCAVLRKQGDDALARHDWKSAAKFYQQLITANADGGDYFDAVCGLAACAAANGDLATAISYYRGIVYGPEGEISLFGPEILMNYALLLHEAGQDREAVFIYNTSVKQLEYDDAGKPLVNVPVLLPLYDADHPPYSWEEFEAMADVGASIDIGINDPKQRLPYLEAAVKLYPTGGIAQFYLGACLARIPGSEQEAIRELRAAEDNGGPQMAAAVIKEERSGTIDFDRAAVKAFGTGK